MLSATATGIEEEVFSPILAQLDRAELTRILAHIDAVRTPAYALWDHSLAVGATSWRLARAMGLGVELQGAAYLAGLLHDAGKTLTRRETLFKPGPLDGAEREHMRLHAVRGADLVRCIGFVAIADAVRSHHELLDGSGYPGGLRGEQIPLLGRIVSVADFYEATREDRPYRPGTSRADALALLERAAAHGKLDPSIARLLASVTRSYSGARPGETRSTRVED